MRRDTRKGINRLFNVASIAPVWHLLTILWLITYPYIPGGHITATPGSSPLLRHPTHLESKTFEVGEISPTTGSQLPILKAL